MNSKRINKNKLSKTFAKKSDEGFTFIEILVALAIVSISMLTLLRLNILSMKAADAAQTNVQAVLLANERIEQIKALDDIKPQSISGTSKRNNLTFYWHSRVENLTVSPVSGIDITGLRKISVDISWGQGLGKKHLKLSTYLADREWK